LVLRLVLGLILRLVLGLIVPGRVRDDTVEIPDQSRDETGTATLSSALALAVAVASSLSWHSAALSSEVCLRVGPVGDGKRKQKRPDARD
jgi:hypothetical protein